MAELDRVLRYDDIETRLENPPDPTVVSDAFPSDWMHGWKFVQTVPDEGLCGAEDEDISARCLAEDRARSLVV